MRSAFKICILLLSIVTLSACTSKSGNEKLSDEKRIASKTDSNTFARPSNTVPETIPSPDYDTATWTEILQNDTSILLDLKYASKDNFVEEKIYACARCFLHPDVANALQKAADQLYREGFRIKLLDCYRPASVQWALWKKMPDPRYVTDPKKGSMHNRGMAVDLTLADLNGHELEMGTPYDYFGPEAHPSYRKLPKSVLERRKLLRRTLKKVGFRPIRTEWWHYSYLGRMYPISDWDWPCK